MDEKLIDHMRMAWCEAAVVTMLPAVAWEAAARVVAEECAKLAEQSDERAAAAIRQRFNLTPPSA